MTSLIESAKSEIKNLKLSIVSIEDSEAAYFYDVLKHKFRLDYNSLFIWSELNRFSDFSYGESVNWGTLIQELMNDFNTDIFLCITNEEFYPWPVLKGKKGEIVELIGSLPFFEYFVFDSNFDELLFDTHDNFFRKVRVIQT
jgi:hypothetical protein